MALLGEFTDWDVRSSERASEIEFRMDGTREFESGESISGDFKIGHSFLPRDDGADLGPDFDLITYQWVNLGGRYLKNSIGPSQWSVGASFEGYNYNDVNGVSNEFLNLNTYEVEGRYEYELGVDGKAMVRPSMLYSDYTAPGSDSNDSVRYTLVGGGTFFPSPLTMIDGFVGVSYTDYIAGDFDNSGGLVMDLNGLWNITPLISLRGNAFVRDENSVIGGAASAFTSRVSAGIDYELFDNLIFGLEAKFENVDYRDTGRVDDNTLFTASVDYFMNEYFFIRGEASMDDRESTDKLQRFENTQVMLRLGTKLCCLLDNKVVNAF